MTAPVPVRRPFAAKFRTSLLKRDLLLRKTLARLARRGSVPPIVRRYFGADFLVFPGELVSEEIAINRFEWREITMMLAACAHHRPDLFVDVGANIGLYACIVGRARLASRVVAFEPEAQNYQ